MERRKRRMEASLWRLAATVSLGVVLLTGCQPGTGVSDALKTDRWRLFNPPKVIQPTERPVTYPIRGSASVVDPTQELPPNATSPRQGDWELDNTDYRIGPQDLVEISVLDLLQLGEETLVRREVSESGFIDLPELEERLRAQNKTTKELKDAISEAYRKQQILRTPTVSVSVSVRRHGVFSILGGVGRPGTYTIPRRDLRLREALAMASGVMSDGIRYVYVIRPAEGAGPAGAPAAKTTGPQAPVVPKILNGGELELPPLPEIPDEGAKKELPAERPEAALPALPSFEPAPEPAATVAATAPAMGLELLPQIPASAPAAPFATAAAMDAAPMTAPVAVAPSGQLAAEVVEAVTVEPGQPVASGVAAAGAAGQVVSTITPEPIVASAPVPAEGCDGGVQSGKWVYVNGQWRRQLIAVSPPGICGLPAEPATILAPKPVKEQAEPRVDEQVRFARAPSKDARSKTDPFGWGTLGKHGASRVIAVNLDRLRAGDETMNIVIRDSDTIEVPVPKSGEFYVMGEVARPGVYSLTGRKVTVKMALAAAGNLGPMAWPENSLLIRRVGNHEEQIIPLDMEAIFQGEDNDIFLKPDDVIAVGTHAVAPIYAVMRNAFRLTYGFGFIYDRNFADPYEESLDSRRFNRW